MALSAVDLCSDQRRIVFDVAMHQGPIRAGDSMQTQFINYFIFSVYSSGPLPSTKVA